jgi:hypothetical protein
MDNTRYYFNNSSVTWEQKGDILEVEGILCEVGTFHPVMIVDGQPSKERATVIFDEQSIINVHNNLVDNFKLWISHAHTDVDSIGWSVKYGLSEDNKRIHWKGLVFDKDGANKILFEGYDKTSMEIHLDLDDSGYVNTGYIVGNAFVKNPAIQSAIPTIKKIAMEYGGIPLKPELVDLLKSKGFTDEELERVANLIEEGAVQDIPVEEKSPIEEEKASPTETTPKEDVVETPKEGSKEGNFGANNMDEVKELKAQLERMNAKFEADNRKELDGVVATLKGFGIDDPEGMVVGFSTENKIKTLRTFSENIVAKMPAIQTPAPTAEQKQQMVFQRSAAFQQAVKDLCVGDLVEQYFNVKVM